MTTCIFNEKITLENRELLESYLDGFDYKTSGLSYTSLFMWRDINSFRWEIIGDYLCIAGVDNLDLSDDNPFMFTPLTRTGTYDPESLRFTVFEAKKRFEALGKTFALKLVPFHMLDIYIQAFPDGLCFEADRPNFDYVYDTKDLIELKGRAYHSKKNHLNYFHAHYEYEYRKMLPSDAEDAMTFIHEFNERKNLEDPTERELLRLEAIAMEDVFENLENVGYFSGVIRIGGKIEAFSVGGRLGTKTVTVHIEKANIQYRGLYQAINNEFCKHMASNVKRINREEDMGIPGLRKAKLSYNPAKFIEKYTINIR